MPDSSSVPPPAAELRAFRLLTEENALRNIPQALSEEEYDAYSACQDRLAMHVSPAEDFDESGISVHINHIASGTNDVQTLPAVGDPSESLTRELLARWSDSAAAGGGGVEEGNVGEALAAGLTEALEGAGVERLTKIQMEVGRAVMGEGKNDVVGLAPNGSGKTFAAAVPIILRVCESFVADPCGLGTENRETKPYPINEPARPRGVIIVPSRELCEQSRDFVRMFCRDFPCCFRVEAVHGGQKVGGTRGGVQHLARGVDIIVATPQRLLDLISIDVICLRDLVVLALDDADKLLTGRPDDETSFVHQVEKLIGLCENQRKGRGSFQRLALSATFSSSSMQNLDRGIVLRPGQHFFIQVGSEAVSSGALCAAGSPQAQHHSFKAVHDVSDVDGETVVCPSKIGALLHLLGNEETSGKNSRRVIVFANTRARADILFRHLQKERIADPGGFLPHFSNFFGLHADLARGKREQHWDSFRRSGGLVVASDLCQRGLDCVVDLVVNFDIPVGKDSLTDFLHRSGRTGRMGNVGRVITLCNWKSDREARARAEIVRHLKTAGVLGGGGHQVTGGVVVEVEVDASLGEAALGNASLRPRTTFVAES